MNLYTNWQQYKNQTAHFSEPDRTNGRGSYVRSLVRDNLTMPYRWDRDAYVTPSARLSTRAKRKSLSIYLASAIRDDDVDYALDLVNNKRNLSNRFIDILHDKFGGYFCSCDDCGTIVQDNDSYSVNDGDRSVCESCKENNYHYSDYHDCYVDDEYDDENGREYENIGEYHSSSENLGHIPSKYDNRTPRVLLGLELEMEIASGYSLDGRAGELLANVSDYRTSDNTPYTYALCEQDGSLDNGFEMVTAYTGLDVHKEQLQFFKQTFAGATSHKTSTCGLHIHICKADMSTLHAAKMVLFINDSDNQKLVYALARRDSSSYSKIHDKKNDKHWLKDAMQAGKRAEDNNKLQKRYQIRNLNADRYEALNFKNDRTIEFRLFKGSLKYQTIMACLEFTFATWHFCKDAGQNQLTTAEFLKFICKAENRSDTRFLRTYLREKGFELPEKSKPAKPYGSVEKTALETL
jgi:hypothetical protein